MAPINAAKANVELELNINQTERDGHSDLLAHKCANKEFMIADMIIAVRRAKRYTPWLQ